jgi:hypothetical protein
MTRPTCKDENCDVQVAQGEKYCAAHNWIIRSWLVQSWAILLRAMKEERKAA